MIKTRITLLVVLLPWVVFAQKKMNRYIGEHFGDHPSWLYFTECQTEIKGDTIFFEKSVFNRDEPKDIKNPMYYQSISMLLGDGGKRVLRDSTNWYRRQQVVYQEGEHSLTVRIYENGRVSTDTTYKSPDGLFFPNIETLELYLLSQDLHENLSFDFLYVENNGFRPFRIKALHKLTRWDRAGESYDALELAIYSKDKSNVRDGQLVIDLDKRSTMYRYYIFHEQTIENGGFKSIGSESWIPLNYAIDLNTIKHPSAANYIEAAFELFNNGGNSEDALILLDNATRAELNYNTINAKINLLDKLKRHKEVERFVLDLPLRKLSS